MGLREFCVTLTLKSHFDGSKRTSDRRELVTTGRRRGHTSRDAASSASSSAHSATVGQGEGRRGEKLYQQATEWICKQGQADWLLVAWCWDPMTWQSLIHLNTLRGPLARGPLACLSLYKGLLLTGAMFRTKVFIMSSGLKIGRPSKIQRGFHVQTPLRRKIKHPLVRLASRTSAPGDVSRLAA